VKFLPRTESYLAQQGKGPHLRQINGARADGDLFMWSSAVFTTLLALLVHRFGMEFDMG